MACTLPQIRFETTSDVVLGDYEFRFVLDGMALTCHALQTHEGIRLFGCRDDLPLRLAGTFQDGELWGVVAELLSTPQDVGVTLSFDGTPLLSEEFRPEYREELPNGPDCGTCTTADPVTFTF
jgi:hypothetical protein